VKQELQEVMEQLDPLVQRELLVQSAQLAPPEQRVHQMFT
jgi:hypothetical protein